MIIIIIHNVIVTQFSSWLFSTTESSDKTYEQGRGNDVDDNACKTNAWQIQSERKSEFKTFKLKLTFDNRLLYGEFIVVFTALDCCSSSIAFWTPRERLLLPPQFHSKFQLLCLECLFIHSGDMNGKLCAAIFSLNGILKFIPSHECRWNHLIGRSENSIWSYHFGRTFCGDLFSKQKKKIGKVLVSHSRRRISCCPSPYLFHTRWPT